MITKNLENELLTLLHAIEELESDFPEINSQKINIFEAAGLVRQEIRHSKALAFLLNPNGTHGLGDLFFKKLITHSHLVDRYHNSNSEFSPSPLKMSLNDFEDLVVRLEDMQIDILMWSPKNKLVLAIENKVGASEGEDQLPRYTRKINENHRFKDYKRLFIYLTAEGDEGSDTNWIPISYKLITEILDDMLVKASMSAETKLFISNYIELIRKHIVNEENEEFKSACLSLYGKHKIVFDLIYENIDLGGSRVEAINKFKEEFKEKIKVNHSSNVWLSFVPNGLHRIMADIVFTRDFHRQTKPIVFFFNLYADRIKLTIEVGPIKDLEIRNKLVKTLFKEIKNSEKEARSDIYTRVWTKSEKLDQDIDDTNIDKIFEIMKTLYSQTDDLIKKIETSLIETFKGDPQN